jgi:hypothetical protein
MTINIAPGAFDPDLDYGGALDFVVLGCEPALGRRGLEAAAGLVMAIPHPEEPEEPLPNFASGVVERAEGAEIWFDVKDETEDPEVMQQIVEAVVSGLNSAGIVDATLTNKRLLGEISDA